MKKKITGAMIAKKAGVSAATMSRYLKDPASVRDDSVVRIEQAMKDLGVAPGIAEPEISSGSPLIIVNIPGLVNTFYQGILRGIQISAGMHGCRVLVHEAELSSGSVPDFCRLVRDVRAAGVILLSPLRPESLAQIRAVAPLVQCCEYAEDADYPYVSIDDRAAAKMATNHLIACGCNKIAMINASPLFRFARHRQEGFLAAMEEAGNFVPQNWIIQLPEISYSLAYSAVCRLLNEDTRPNAFFAVSDIYAVSVIRAAKRFGLRIPEEVMIVGFDNLDVTAMTCPSVTSVSQHSYQQGYSACELLVDMVEQPDLAPKPILVDTELVLRESTFPGNLRLTV